ncbi:hypothetical protein JD276_14070 [Leucobacter sp. CSA1]|uniref:Head-to-tail adaptor n=1 Tax=Leucobacter chromiisoli TaxID=2796471 RepID=A0A934QA81_9MICO|nr:hypothetical protein [Leucobacter chromiisoli]MBK0420160.1 hypothetical protein [Leucobacter chromiisoli]
MADVYATADDLRELWPDMPVGSDEHAGVLLAAASAVMRAEARDIAGVDSELLKLIACEMVKTAMRAPAESDGLASLNLSAGPFSQQASFRADPTDLFLTKKHRRWLGIGRQRAFSIDLLRGRDEVP